MELFDLGKLPIPGDKASGRDVRSEDIYEQLVVEINKRGALNSVGPTNWANVVNLSQSILQNYSKDILVCSYFCVGLLNTTGLKGLANGVHVYFDLLENYWDSLYPPRIGGRVNAMEWWLNTVNEQLRKIASEVWSENDLNLLKQDFDGIIAFFARLEINEPTEIRAVKAKCLSLISIENSVSQQAALNQENTPATSLEAAVLNKIPPLNSSVSNVNHHAAAIHLPDIINVSDLDSILRPIFSNLSKVVECLHREQPLSYLLFKINRFVAWANVSVVPPCDNEFTTMLAPPDFQLISTLQQLYQAKNWFELLKTSEARIVEFRFWLDLSYYSYQARINLNQHGAAQELAYETLNYIKRLAGIEKLLFSDGTAFAKPETQAWLIELDQTKTRSNLSSVAMNNPSINNDEFNKDIDEVRQLVEDGDLPSAISKLHSKIQLATTKSERFIRIMYFCKFVSSIKHKYLAKPYLDELLECCKDYQLDAWDPSLASEAYQIILDFSNYKDLGFDSSYVNAVLGRLVLIDPVSSLKFHQ